MWLAAVDSTYCRVDKSEENDSANDSPHGVGRALLKSLRDDLVEAVTHATQLRRESASSQPSETQKHTHRTAVNLNLKVFCSCKIQNLLISTILSNQ